MSRDPVSLPPFPAGYRASGLLLHVAAKDQFVPPDAQAKVKDALKGNSLVAIYTYSEQDHAFARVGGAHYDKAAADQANARTAEFFKKNLA